MPMSDTQYQLLKYLEQEKTHMPDNGMVTLEAFNGHTIKSLERDDLIQTNADRTYGKITVRGLEAFDSDERSVKQSRWKSKIHPFSENKVNGASQLMTADKQEETVPDEVNEQKKGGDCPKSCDSCIHRELLDLIAEKYPQVAALRDVMLVQKQLLNELNLGD